MFVWYFLFYMVGTLLHQDECIPMLGDEALQRKIQLPFPLPSMQQIVLLLNLRLPLIFAHILHCEGCPCLIPIPFFIERALLMQHRWCRTLLPLNDNIWRNYHLGAKCGHVMLRLPALLQLIHGDQNVADWVEVLAWLPAHPL